MKLQKLIFWIAVTAVLLNITAADAQPRRGFKRGLKLESRLQTIELTAKQNDQLKVLKLAQGKKMAQLQADQKIAQLELSNLLEQSDPMTNEIKSKVATLNEARGKILETRVKFRVNLKKILTQEQREKLKKMDRRKHHDKRQRAGRKGRPNRRIPKGQPPFPKN